MTDYKLYFSLTIFKSYLFCKFKLLIEYRNSCWHGCISNCRTSSLRIFNYYNQTGKNDRTFIFKNQKTIVYSPAKG
jgi:hypothetical protein